MNHVVVDVAGDREVLLHLVELVEIDHRDRVFLAVDHLLLTLGERGMLLASRDGSLHTVETVAREVYDVVGAGDTVTAYLAAIMGAGGSAAEASVIANYAAGVEVGKLGAATVTPAEVLEAYDHFATQHELAASDSQAPDVVKR